MLLVMYWIMALGIHHLVENKHISQSNFEITGNLVSKPSIYGNTLKNELKAYTEQDYFTHYVLIGDTSNVSILYNGKALPMYKVQLVNKPPSQWYTHVSDTNTRVYSLADCVPANITNLPYYNQFINFKGGWSLCYIILQSGVLWCMLILFVIVKYVLPNLKYKYSINYTSDIAPNYALPKIIIVWALFISLFYLLCNGDMYYFMQDDNYAQFTPTLLQGFKGWYTQGTIPTYNPLQYGGVGTMEYSTYAFWYFPAHISYIVAQYVLGNALYFNFIFALLHFAVGYYFMYKVATKLGVQYMLALAAGLCYVYSGYTIMAVRSWYYVAPTVAFLPIFCYGIACIKLFTVRNYILAVVLGIVYIYSGNFQYFVYTSILICSLYLYKFGLHVKGIGSLLLIITIIFICYLPQLLLTYHAIHNVHRSSGGQGIVGGLASMLFPFVTHNAMPNGWGTPGLQVYTSYFYYGGYTLLSAALLYIMLVSIRPKWLFTFRHIPLFQAYFFGLVICLIMALGVPGILWYIVGKLPLFNLFSHPFKFLLYVQFFGILCGVVLIQHVLKQYAVKYTYLFLIQSIGCVVWQVIHTQDAFFAYNYTKPYQAPNYNAVLHTNHNYRIMPLAVSRSTATNYDQSLTMNFATMQTIPSIYGYEPLYNHFWNVEENYSAYGVRYIIQSNYKPSNPLYIGTTNLLSKLHNYHTLAPIYTDSIYTIWENKTYTPLVVIYNNEMQPIYDAGTLSFNNNGISYITNYKQQVHNVLLNYTYTPHCKVYINNVQYPIVPDALNRIVIPCNTIINSIKLVYKVPFW